MRRVLLDTNIYGLIVKKKEIDLIKSAFECKKNVLIYGFDIIRKELRDVPKKLKLKEGLL